MDFLKSIAPWLAAAATGNVPALVGMAANELTSVLGYAVEPEKTAIEKAVSGATQEQLIKLKELDQVFQIKMQELGFNTVDSLVKAEVSDKASMFASLNIRLMEGENICFPDLNEAVEKDQSLNTLGQFLSAHGTKSIYFFPLMKADGEVYGMGVSSIYINET